jgi:transposase
MSLQAEPMFEIPEMTVEIARAAFPQGNVYLTLGDKLGTIFENDDFADLYPERGQPALSPWRLALVTIMQFRENMSDRQAADAVRSRIDWKYLLGLDLSDPGFDFSILSEFRSRLLGGEAEARLLDKLLDVCQSHNLVKARGKQRTDSTRVLASIRVMNRLEQVGETVRAALNELATVAPEWLQQVALPEWYKRYSHRIEADRLPKSESGRQEYGQVVGEDGFNLMDLVTHKSAPAGVADLPTIKVLSLVWERHYERENGNVRFKENRELANAPPGAESPYDPEARYRFRSGKSWVGYMVHVSETCDDDRPHLITHVETTTANVHEAQCTEKIHQALVDKHLPPHQHLVDAAYVGAELLVSSKREHSISLVGPG